jgi:hypothetical protein
MVEFRIPILWEQLLPCSAQSTVSACVKSLRLARKFKKIAHDTVAVWRVKWPCLQRQCSVEIATAMRRLGSGKVCLVFFSVSFRDISCRGNLPLSNPLSSRIRILEQPLMCYGFTLNERSSDVKERSPD